MPKKRVATNLKPMRFETIYGTDRAVDKQQHAEEREAKRWMQTRLDNARKLAEKYERSSVASIADVAAGIKGRDLMAMKPDTSCTWQYVYDGIPVYCKIVRLP